MMELLLPYLLAVAGFVVAIVVALFAQQASENARLAFEQKEARIPDFLRYTDLRSEIDELELQLAQRREELVRAETVITEANTKKEWLSRNEEAIQRAEHARRDLERMEGDLTSLVEQVSQKSEELRKLKDEERDAAWQCKLNVEQATVAKKEREEALARCETARSELGELRQAIDSERKTLAGLQGTIVTQKIECDRLLAEHERLEKAVTELTAQRKELAQAIKELENHEATLRSSVAQLDEKSSALKARVAAGGGGVGTVEDPLDELKVSVVSKASFANRPSVDNEQAALAKLKESLRDEGLIFHTRVIEAFHTALKVQNESPLLVLAGISGTGKSLLPQRYAEVLGMHSLMVPVQPRWDGPQDLLGFFNYLEGRYKPTELSRALVQFDRFATVLPDEAEKLDDRMLLVLFDEMNLARVEYYFSEFLSRLEARRSLDENKAEQRKRASIAIEVGAAGGATQEYQVFAGPNVLFVGTINEDESTQALSDKVVDRANVMRFGRPTRLADTRAEPVNRRAPSSSGSYLRRETWLSWIREAEDLDVELRKMALRHIASLNDALKDVGRPFAYRTRDAILAYLRHYPGRSEKRVKLALADQIEQRVLPKLRGIDPSEPGGNNALRQVQDVVTQLGDEELAEAIEQGKTGSHGHSFLWHGVDRRPTE